MAEEKTLILGWTLDSDLHPKAWKKGHCTNPKNTRKTDLTTVKSELLATGTAIIAQSGSGKSFFLGRLLEEIVMNTNAKCLVIDPNGDFRAVTKVVSEQHWKSATYDQKQRKGWLPAENSGDDFRKRWKQTSIVISSNTELRYDSSLRPPHRRELINISWFDVPAQFVAAQLRGSSLSEIKLSQRIMELVFAICTSSFPGKGHPLSYKEIVGVAEEVVVGVVSSGQVEAILRFAKLDTNEGNDWRTAEIPEDRKKVILESPAVKELRAIIRLIRAENFSSYLACVYDNIVPGRNLRHTSRFDFNIQPWDDNFRLRVVDISSEVERSKRFAMVSSILINLQRYARDQWERAMNEEPEKDKEFLRSSLLMRLTT